MRSLKCPDLKNEGLYAVLDRVCEECFLIFRFLDADVGAKCKVFDQRAFNGCDHYKKLSQLNQAKVPGLNINNKFFFDDAENMQACKAYNVDAGVLISVALWKGKEGKF
uniref:Uncharacterized protein n=1 Tax=Romanomermis culicivorax TaxID=13658 RepID=A0A915HUJ4_ROMCU